jgi:hypothetical protein
MLDPAAENNKSISSLDTNTKQYTIQSNRKILITVNKNTHSQKHENMEVNLTRTRAKTPKTDKHSDECLNLPAYRIDEVTARLDRDHHALLQRARRAQAVQSGQRRTGRRILQ